MKRLVGALLALSLVLSGCGGMPFEQKKSTNGAHSFGPPQIVDEQVYINEVLEELPETFGNKELPTAITLYRLETLPEEFQLGYIENWDTEVRYRYFSKEFKEQSAKEGWKTLDAEAWTNLEYNGTIYFNWMTADKNMTEEEATAFLQRFAEGSDMYPYGDTGYYINRAPHSPQRTDVQFIFMWMQDNHVFEMGLPGSPEISEENIADYCRAEAFTVLTNQ